MSFREFVAVESVAWNTWKSHKIRCLSIKILFLLFYSNLAFLGNNTICVHSFQVIALYHFKNLVLSFFDWLVSLNLIYLEHFCIGLIIPFICTEELILSSVITVFFRFHFLLIYTKTLRVSFSYLLHRQCIHILYIHTIF